MGQGVLRFRHKRNPLQINKNPEEIKTPDLCSEIHIRPETFALNPAITAPKPKLTSNAGRAQQRSVVREVKRAKKERYVFKLITF